MIRWSRALATALAMAFAFAPGSATAQGWPSKPIRLVVPYAPGGIGDFMARLIAPMISDATGQPALVENKPGANGTLATDQVAKSAPDGYTLLVGLAAPQTLSQFISKVNYDGLKDFVPITLLNTNPLVVAVHPSVPVRNVQELIALAKAQPGKLSFAGAGGLTQFAGEIFKYMAGLDMVHVTYRGGAPAVAATVAGDVQLTFANYSDALTWINSGRLRAIAVTSARRFPASPDLPTVAEGGLPGFAVEGWTGLFAPAGTPPQVVERIATAVRQGLREPALRKRLEDMGALPGGSSPEEFREFVRQELDKWEAFVKQTGIKVE